MLTGKGNGGVDRGAKLAGSSRGGVAWAAWWGLLRRFCVRCGFPAGIGRDDVVLVSGCAVLRRWLRLRRRHRRAPLLGSYTLRCAEAESASTKSRCA